LTADIVRHKLPDNSQILQQLSSVSHGNGSLSCKIHLDGALFIWDGFCRWGLVGPKILGSCGYWL